MKIKFAQKKIVIMDSYLIVLYIFIYIYVQPNNITFREENTFLFGMIEIVRKIPGNG